VELHHQLLPRLAGEALLLGQGAMPYRRGSVPQCRPPVKRATRAHGISRYAVMSLFSMYPAGSFRPSKPNRL
jgi:hypothetical protein